LSLLWLSLAFLTGLLLAEVLGWSVGAWILLAGLSLTGLFAPRLYRRWRVTRHVSADLPTPEVLAEDAALNLPQPPVYSLSTILLLAGFFVCLGGIRLELARPASDPGQVSWYADLPDEIILHGVLIRPADPRDTFTSLLMQAQALQTQAAEVIPVEGRVLVRVTPGGDWQYGDEVLMSGQLTTPPEDEEFSYRDYLSRQGIYSYMSPADGVLLQRDQGNPIMAVIYNLKEHALATAYRIFPDPEASLMAGILLGVETGIPQDVRQAFVDTGTSHLIAISGFNIALVSGMIAFVLGRLFGQGRQAARRGAFVAAIMIAIYAILVGGEPPVIRAAIMAGLGLLASQLGRRQNGLTSLVFIAVIMALFNPYVIWQVGFQLTFAATLGLILFAEPLLNGFTRLAGRWLPADTLQRMANPVGEYFLFTLAAGFTVLPVLIYHFQRLSLVGILANPLVLPAQPPLMMLGGLAVISGLFFPALGQGIAYLCWPFATYTLRVVEGMANLPGSAISLGQVSTGAVLLFYLLLAGWALAGQQLKEWLRRQVPSALQTSNGLLALAVASMAVAAVLVWREGNVAPDGRLHLTVLDVGSGDGLLIQSPQGRWILVDGGPSSSRLAAGLGRRLPLFQRELDYLVVAATGDEQLAALPATLERYPAKQVLWAGQAGGSRSASALQQFLAAEQIPVLEAQSGQVLDLGQGAVLRLLTVGRRGAVLLLTWNKFRVLLPVGLDFDSLEKIMADPDLRELTALLLAENGYAPVNPPELFARLHPQMVLLSVGAGDRNNLPDAQTLQALDGYTLLRTDRHGWIELSTDGQQMWVEVEK
jgi:competence protein ComEC